MSLWAARLIYRWRLILSGLIVLGAFVLAPRAQIQTIDNDLTAWFSEDDPVYRDYVRFRDEFGGTRNLIIAIEGPSRDRMFSREVFAFLEKISGDIEQVQAVQRVSSLATATVVDSLSASGPDDDGGLRVRRLIEDLERDSPDVVGQRAIDDELLRGDLVSEDGTLAAVIVFFDEARIDEVRAEVLGEIRQLVTSQLPAGLKVHFNGSLEISEWYNRVTIANQTRFIPPILVITMLALFVMFRSVKNELNACGTPINPPTVDNTASTISGTVIDHGDSCGVTGAWWSSLSSCS